MSNLQYKSQVISLLSIEFLNAMYDGKPKTGKHSKLSALLEKPMVANPDPAPQIPVDFDEAAIMTLVPDAEFLKIEDTFISKVLEALESRNVSRLSLQFAMALKKQWISQLTYNSLMAEIQKTQDDPNHPAQVPGTSRWETICSENNIPISAINVEWAEETV
jgi:hypothetical protein